MSDFDLSVLRMGFFQIGLAGSALVGLLCGLLSPVVVLKERAYIGDLLAHYVFPGVVAGYLLALRFDWPTLPCLFVGACITGFLGTMASEFMERWLRLPSDSASIVSLTGFFGLGALLVSRQGGARINLETFLFGDILSLRWSDVAVLALAVVGVGAVLGLLRRHWEAWLSDPEFAILAGFRSRTLDRIFPVVITSAVLASLFAAGGLMISALLALPAILVRPRSVLSLKVVATGLGCSLSGFVLAFAFDWPVGGATVVLGLLLVLSKALMVKAKSLSRPS